jgi:hypothetical protein
LPLLQIRTFTVNNRHGQLRSIYRQEISATANWVPCRGNASGRVAALFLRHQGHASEMFRPEHGPETCIDHRFSDETSRFRHENQPSRSLAHLDGKAPQPQASGGPAETPIVAISRESIRTNTLKARLHNVD